VRSRFMESTGGAQDGCAHSSHAVYSNDTRHSARECVLYVPPSVSTRDDRRVDRSVDESGRDCGRIAQVRDSSRDRLWTNVWASRSMRSGTSAAVTLFDNAVGCQGLRQ